jgi:hypothetical protein
MKLNEYYYFMKWKSHSVEIFAWIPDWRISTRTSARNGVDSTVREIQQGRRRRKSFAGAKPCHASPDRKATEDPSGILPGEQPMNRRLGLGRTPVLPRMLYSQNARHQVPQL